MKKERVRRCEVLLVMVHRCSMVTLDNIVTLDESTVFFHTSKTKEQSIQWLVSLAQ
jgi:hypothetical protein